MVMTEYFYSRKHNYYHISYYQVLVQFTALKEKGRLGSDESKLRVCRAVVDSHALTRVVWLASGPITCAQKEADAFLEGSKVIFG